MGPKVIPKNLRRRELTLIQKLFRLVYFTPLVVLLLERLWIPLEFRNLGGYLNVEATATTTTSKESHYIKNTNLPTLEQLTTSSRLLNQFCQSGSIDVSNQVGDKQLNKLRLRDRDSTIPRILHQATASKCMSGPVVERIRDWRSLGFQYYFHDEEAMNKLLSIEFEEFPHLRQVVRNCVTTLKDKVKLWSYLVLWAYGGIYVDLKYKPDQLRRDALSGGYDGLLLLDSAHSFNGRFIAISSRHPIMYHAIHHFLRNRMMSNLESDVQPIPDSLEKAFQDFLLLGSSDQEKRDKTIRSGIVGGSGNRSIRIASDMDLGIVYVQELASSAREGNPSKSTSKGEPTHQTTCFSKMLSETMEAYHQHQVQFLGA